jgi:GntR family transcriptional regulator
LNSTPVPPLVDRTYWQPSAAPDGPARRARRRLLALGAIAHLQENISAGPVSFGSGSAAAAPLELDDDGGTTLLAALYKRGGRVLGPGECQIGLSQVGPSRAKLLDLRASDPVLVLTQYVRHANRPFYLAKCLIPDRAGHLSVMQSLQS